MTEDRSQWMNVAKMMGKREIILGRYLSYWFEKTPRRALYYTAYYKFASKMIGKDKRVLDVGCSEGLGTWMLAVECGFAQGVDLDEKAIETALQNWTEPKVQFLCGDFFDVPSQPFNAVVSFDVIEHILPSNAEHFFTKIQENLTHDGVAIIGTPSLEGQRYASDISKSGHVNIYSFERLEEAMMKHFTHVFMFCANDEVIHTGYPRMAQYLIAIGCKKKKN
jgi:2-polyprenyl-3-methyl-5-hydroxy-6-metoxy-1,4-benzoquinol methylase